MQTRGNGRRIRVWYEHDLERKMRRETHVASRLMRVHTYDGPREEEDNCVTHELNEMPHGLDVVWIQVGCTLHPIMNNPRS